MLSKKSAKNAASLIQWCTTIHNESSFKFHGIDIENNGDWLVSISVYSVEGDKADIKVKFSSSISCFQVYIPSLCKLSFWMQLPERVKPDDWTFIFKEQIEGMWENENPAYQKKN